ncbi:MAG: MbnB/TglH/ChrH family RiPP precursor modification enzyme, partial [Deltaproteobacteria bacterium]
MDLPYLGLGLSTNLGARDRPDPHRLAAQTPGLLDFVEYSAPLSLPEALAQAPRLARAVAERARLPLVFHPVYLNLWGPRLETSEALAALAAQLRETGSPWVGNDVAWWHSQGEPFPGYLYLPPPLDERGLLACAAHARHVQGALPVPLLLENPVVLERSGPLHVLDFMGRLHARTGCSLLLDLGHLLAFQLSSGLLPTAGLDGFPLDRVVEIHLAGGVVTQGSGRQFYADDHSQPVREELFELLGEVLPRCLALRAVTFEGDGQPEPVARRTLERLRALVRPPAADAPSPAAQLPPRAIELGSSGALPGAA